MKNFKLDLFKISLVLILLGFLFLFDQYTKNGRFHISNDGTSIIDTRTGTVWNIYDNEDRKHNAELYSNPILK